jgi:succinate dehydrogenase/fumarate reductase flavoprotein subunit
MNACDVLVAGAGRAGLAAALAAVELGCETIVLEKATATAAAQQTLRDRNVTLLSGCRASRLIVESGRVVGVTLAAGHAFRARVRVVLATGGYESDPVLTRRFEDLPNLVSLYPPSATGDGLRMGGSVGARIQLERNNLNIRLVDEHGAIVDVARPNSTIVNRFGQRFANEAAPAELAAALRVFDARTRTFTNLPCWQIFEDAAGSHKHQLYPSITSSAGLATDRDARVLNWYGQAIPGLYAAGRLAAMAH